MSLYLKPPRGLVNLHIFQECVEQRLNGYDCIYRKNKLEITNLEYLIEDSVLDRTSHYLFRLCAYFSSRFREIFLECEKKLLLLRLTWYHKDDVKYFLKRTLKHSKECLTENGIHAVMKEIYVFLIHLCSHMLNSKYLNDMVQEAHQNCECDKFELKVPFYVCPSLFVHREVKLHKGYVELHSTEWKKIFVSLYETYLKRTLNEMNFSQNVQTTVNDVRIQKLLEIIQNHWFTTDIHLNYINWPKFDVTNINHESKWFPLCMLNLFKVLQKTNRLSHNDRYDFSLFMKEIGISLVDSIKFWENVYTKQHSSCSKCSHNWKENEKRYIYGIRHLYGLEGSRKNYKVRSCNYFQEKTLGATEDGGCPFKHFDDDNLRLVLKYLLPNKEDDVEVIIYERKENPSESCRLFYENIFKISSNNSTVSDISFSNPVEYYLSLKKSIFESTNDSKSDSSAEVRLLEK